MHTNIEHSEDDADVYSDLLYRINHCLRGDHVWDISDLGSRQSWNEEPTKTSECIYKHGYKWSTECILYNKNAIRKLKNILYLHDVVSFLKLFSLSRSDICNFRWF